MYKYLISILLFLPLMASASFDRDLFYGLRSDSQVTELQEFLTAQGVYSGPITGNFFALTQKAVKSFQIANLISSTGYFGPLTRTKANSLLPQVTDETGTPVSPVTTAPATIDTVVTKLNEQIALLQQQLQKLQEQQTALTTSNQKLTEQNQKLGTIETKQMEQAATLQAIQANTIPQPAPVSQPVPVPAKIVKKEVVVESVGPCKINFEGTAVISPCRVQVWYRENGKRSNVIINVTSETGIFSTSTTATTIDTDGEPSAFFDYFPLASQIKKTIITGRFCTGSGCSDNGGITYFHNIRIKAIANGTESPESSMSLSSHYLSQ